MAKRKPSRTTVVTNAKRKRKGRIRKAAGRWAWRHVNQWAASQRAKMRKALAPKVVATTKETPGWERVFPDPRRSRPPVEMRRVYEWMAQFEVRLDSGWTAEFAVDVHDPHASIRQAAYDTVERVYGQVARTREIAEVKPLNDLADELLAKDGKALQR
jgi:hypothetical protein